MDIVRRSVADDHYIIASAEDDGVKHMIGADEVLKKRAPDLPIIIGGK